MRGILLLFSFLIQSSLGFGQAITFYDSYQIPIFDTSKVDVEYIRVQYIENGVFHDQLFTIDSVKVSHLIALLDENDAKKSQQVTSYFPDGTISSKTKTDFENDRTEEMLYYHNGKIKQILNSTSGTVDTEQFFSVDGEEIKKPEIVEATPQKGKDDWINYLMRNLRYPAEARKLKKTGTVLLKVKLDEEGMIEGISVLNSDQIHYSLAKEAIRVTMEYPNRWNPQTENGQPVPSEVRLPFRFLLEASVR